MEPSFRKRPSGPPLVSVLMGMHNCAGVLAEAIESLCAQTFADWELVACDDGSSDDTWEVASGFARRHPDRIVLLRNETNQGLAASLNRCLAVARGTLLARQDADDLSEPGRFERQVRFLGEHPEYGWVSAGMTVFDETGALGVRRGKPLPTQRDLIRSSCFAHAPTMFRAEVLRAVGGYRVAPYTRRTEDYDLWMRLFVTGRWGYNLQEPLYRVREDRSAYSRKTLKGRLEEAMTRYHGFRAMRAPLWAYLYVLRPLAVALLPLSILRRLHELRLGRSAPDAGP